MPSHSKRGLILSVAIALIVGLSLVVAVERSIVPRRAAGPPRETPAPFEMALNLPAVVTIEAEPTPSEEQFRSTPASLLLRHAEDAISRASNWAARDYLEEFLKKYPESDQAGRAGGLLRVLLTIEQIGPRTSSGET